MRRTASAMFLRLVALIIAVLIAAPAVAATPGRSGSTTSTVAPSAAAPRTASLTARGKEKGTAKPRGRVNADRLKKSGHPRPNQGPLAKVRLGIGGSETGTRPRVSGPLVASSPATQVAKPDIATATPLPGLGYGTATTTLEPPDPFVAVGPDHVVQVTNVAMRVQRRQGENLLANTALSDMFLLPGPADDPPIAVTYNSDPRVLYDSRQGRWFISELSYDCTQRYDSSAGPDLDPAMFGHGFIDFAISDTADPDGNWLVYSLGANDVLFDFPAVGTSTDKIVISANMYNFNSHTNDFVCGFDDSFQGSVLIGFDWAQLKLGGDVDYQVLSESVTPGLASQFAIRPAIQVPSTSATVFAVAERLPDRKVSVLRITGDPKRSALTLAASIENVTDSSAQVPPFGDPPPPQQPGTTATLDFAVDGRPTDALWQNNRLVFVATTNCPIDPGPTNRDCVRVGELNTTSATTQTQDFLLSEVGKDYYFGGIGLSQSGSLHVTYTRSSSTAGDYPSGYEVYQLPGDAANTVSTPKEVLHGLSDYAGERWGDYMGIAADPQRPGAVWRTNEAADGSHHWTTDVALLDTDFGSTYTALTTGPVRVLDTRPAPNHVGSLGVFRHNIAQTFQITNGGTIPNTAVAVTGNLTVTQQTAAGFVSLTPRPTNSPSTSTINFPLGDTRANNITLPLGPGGKLSAVYKSGTGKTTHLILDITGYFTAGAGQALYTPLPPARILDTRPAPYNIALSGKFRNATPRQVHVRGRGGVPDRSTVVAVTGNVTVTQQTSGGFVSFTTTYQPTPTTSTINFLVGDNRANGQTIPLAADGTVWAVFRGSTGATTHLIVDITGYYETGATGLRFYPLNPGRIMDTRAGAVLSGLTGAFTGTTTCPSGVRTLDTAGHQGIPLEGVTGAAAITGNLTVTKATKGGFVSIRKNLADCPETSTINFPAGDTRANGTTVPVNTTGDLRFRYNSAAGTAHLILDISGYFAP